MDIAVVAVLGAFAVAIANIWSRARIRELKVRERIAMIEKGLVPPPESDPAGFERAMGKVDGNIRRGERSRGKHQRVGILMLSVGVGTMILVGSAGDTWREGVGIGGFFVALALGFFLIGLLERPRDPGSPKSSAPSLPSPPQ
jgi:hypothetical protein